MDHKLFAQGHALVIGVGADLKCTIDDANGFKDILVDKERCAYSDKQVTLLTEHDANRANIIKALDNLAKSANHETSLIVYFSGHGYKHGDSYYLIPNGCTLDNFPNSALSGAEFASKISAIPASKKIILLDCCHAGGVGDVKDFGLTKSPLPQEALDLFQQGNGYVLIASSMENEKSYTGKPYSLFTGALIEALCGQGVAKKDGYVRVADLIGHTRERVPQLSKNKQHPVIHFEQADNFVISYYAGGENQPKALAFKLEMEINRNDTLRQSIKNIQDLFVRARYPQAYEQFHHLCESYPDYYNQSGMILTRYNNFQNQIISGIIPAQQQNTTNMEIAVVFQTCLKQFSQEYLTNEQ